MKLHYVVFQSGPDAESDWVSNDGGYITRDVAERFAKKKVAEGVPAYVKNEREMALGLPVGPSPRWDYDLKCWKAKSRSRSRSVEASRSAKKKASKKLPL